MNAPTACFMFAHKTKGEHGVQCSNIVYNSAKT